MRRIIIYPKDGQERTIRKFLFRPKTINCERRWLEWSRFLQRYHERNGPGDRSYWNDIKWID